MAKEFAVFKRFTGILADNTEPVGLIVLNDDKIEIYGATRKWKNQWVSYFENSRFERHLSTASPLSSIFSAPYGAPSVYPISDQYKWILDSTKQKMTGKVIKITLKK